MKLVVIAVCAALLFGIPAQTALAATAKSRSKAKAHTRTKARTSSKAKAVSKTTPAKAPVPAKPTASASAPAPPTAATPVLEAGPTLEETVKWISEKLKTSGGFKATWERGRRNESYKGLELAGTSLVLTEEVEEELGGYPKTKSSNTYTIPIADMEMQKVFNCAPQEWYGPRELWKIPFRTKSGGKSISVNYVRTEIDGKTKDSRTSVDYFCVDFCRQDIAERVKTAFEHIIKSVPAAKEPF